MWFNVCNVLNSVKFKEPLKDLCTIIFYILEFIKSRKLAYNGSPFKTSLFLNIFGLYELWKYAISSELKISYEIYGTKVLLFSLISLLFT